MLPRIFEMFAQVDSRSARSGGGLGIGLGLVRNLVRDAWRDDHGPQPRPRQRKRVRRQDARPLDRSCIATGRGRGPRRPGNVRRHRVLVVDDNADAANSLARLLARLYGQDVRVSNDGASALEAAGDFRPDVVLLDIGMPGMDGYEVARRLRSRPGFEQTLLAALTGWGQQSDRRRSAEAGFDRHLVKPVDTEQLESLLAGSARSGPSPHD